MKKFFSFFILLLMLIALISNAYADEKSVSQFFDQHGAVILLVDPQDGKIVYANNAAEKFYGYEKQKLLTMSISQINTLSPEKTHIEMQAANAESRNYFVFKHRLSNGDIRTVEVFSYPSTFENKNVLLSIVHDVTDKVALAQKNQELQNTFYLSGLIIIFFMSVLVIILFANFKKLKTNYIQIQNLDYLRKTFFDAYNSLVYLKDENLKYVFVNKAFMEFYSLTEEEVIGKDDFSISSAEFAQKRRNTDLNVLEKNSLVVDDIKWNERIYRSIKFPVKLLGGKLGIGAYVKDVSDEIKQITTLQKVHNRNTLLLNVINHSFNSIQEQLDYVLNEALKLTESEFGYIYLYDEGKKEFTLNSWSLGVMEECRVMEKQTKYSLEKTGIWGEVVRQRKPIIVNDFVSPNPMKKGYPEGHVQIHRYMSVPIVIDGKIVAVIGFANKKEPYDESDISEITILMNGVWNAVERRAVLDKLFIERNKYMQTLFSIGDGVMVVDKNGNVEMLNDIAQKLTGWALEEARGVNYKNVLVLANENEGMEIKDPVEAVFKTDTVQELENHAVLISKDGKRYCLEDSAAPIKDENNKTNGVILVFRDVTEKKDQIKKIEYLSFHDSLTCLYNRRFFEEELARLDTPRNLPISIIMGDVNGLKLTNDIFGHKYGDILLQTTGKAFRKVCRKDEIVARWGGDEFVMLLPNTSSIEAQEIISRVKKEFAKSEIKAIKGSISMGCDTKYQADDDIMITIEKAEEKMYLAKAIERDENKNTAVSSMMDNLHAVSPYDKSHSENVSRLCEMLGRALELPEVDVKRLKDAGYLHDIGKIILDHKLLNKSFSPESTELKEIQKHPIIGYRILNAFDETLDLAEFVLTHQEYWDGSGYPKGLKGQEIPLLSRIITLVEAYERVTNDWGDNKALNKREAIEYVRENSGVLFDPEICEVFINMISNDTKKDG